MKFILNNSTDPYYNLALEEYCLKNVDMDEDYFLLWQNAPAIIVGKNQNTFEEINPRFVEERNIKVARRISGGGAVYHDFGNLNFTFIANIEDATTVDFKKYAMPIIEALKTLNIKAELSGRNDIIIDGKKISGNAQRMYRKKLMQHGTLLFDVNIHDLVDSLNVKMDKITSKGIKSVRSRVTNIKEHLDEEMDIKAFWELIQLFLSDNGNSDEILLTLEEKAEVQRMRDERFSTWDWNYGASPKFDIYSEKRFAGGKIEFAAVIKEGIIDSIRFFGDYLGLSPVDPVEESLVGQKYEMDSVRKILEKVHLGEYFGKITLDELLEVMFA
ncbi:MAG: lipoate--protein ligase [Peptostreptococcaceae bacterium]|nr:lipoate--protein ligase [Peptostreptococcaceae bacterium]